MPPYLIYFNFCIIVKKIKYNLVASYNSIFALSLKNLYFFNFKINLSNAKKLINN